MKDQKNKHEKLTSVRPNFLIVVVLLFGLLIAPLFESFNTSAFSVSEEDEGSILYFPDDIYDPIDPSPVIPDPSDLSRRIGGYREDSVGSFVFFDVVDEGIENHTHYYTEEKIVLFKSISVENLVIYEQKTESYLYNIKSDRADFQIYDDTSAKMKIDVKPSAVLDGEVSVSFEIDEENADIIPIGNEGVKIDYGAFTATLVPYGPMEGRMDITGRNGRPTHITFTVTEDTLLIFWIEDERIYEDFNINEMMRVGIIEKQIGGKIRVESENEQPYHMSVIYDDISLLGRALDNRTLHMMVSSHTLGEEGNIVVADLSSTVMNVTSFEKLNVAFDGEPIPEVDSYSELTAKSSEAACLILRGREGVMIFVNVPHFSTHSIVIEGMIDISEAALEENYLGVYLYYIPTLVFSGVAVSFGSIYKIYKEKIEKTIKDKKDDSGERFKGKKGQEKKVKKTNEID
ncbi:MAG: hypothetical protein R6U17_02975 [Thermoplasmata archaeon]